MSGSRAARQAALNGDRLVGFSGSLDRQVFRHMHQFVSSLLKVRFAGTIGSNVPGGMSLG